MGRLVTAMPTEARAKETVRKIRQRYPHPGTYGERPGVYCVAGAFIRYMAPWYIRWLVRLGGWRPNRYNFPTPVGIIAVLQRANPDLTYYPAYDASCAIVWHNDSGEYDAAWKRLEKALAYPGEKDERA